ncbi:MAG: LytTR family transcriptional regulator DNA-binding domain-containing protein [Bacteroidales bacterium]|nr:LytTR family transcriptional regulator DNA-binding domain-containing protein [Bacteroidales bacterium]
MNKLRTIIVEDEAPARELVKAYLKSHENIELIAECDNGFCGVKAINETKPDLVLLDIQMPKLTGFELLELLDEIPEIIFTTAYDQYAIKAFELSAVDYLMKPFSKARFDQALEKVFARLKQKTKSGGNIRRLAEKAKKDTGTIERVFVKTGTKIDVVPVDEIIRIEAQDDYVEFITATKKYLKKETMNFLEGNLPEKLFVRVHRSHIINVNYIKKIEKYGKESHVIVLNDGSKVNVSKSRIGELKQQLGF